MNFKVSLLLKIILFTLVVLIIGTNSSYAFSTEDLMNYTTKTIHDDYFTMKDAAILYAPIIVTLISLLIFFSGKDISFANKIIAGAVFIIYILAIFFSDGKLVFSVITLALAIITNMIILLNEDVSATGKVLSACTIAFVILNAIISIM